MMHALLTKGFKLLVWGGLLMVALNAHEGRAADEKTPEAFAGNWYGDSVYFGYHYDMHAGNEDPDIGAGTSLENLLECFELMKPDLVGADTKGHGGLTSWFSQTPTASVAPNIVQDPLPIWREATRRIGVPLQCHYSGIFDGAAGTKHPDWCAVKADGEILRDKMCPRGPYVDELLIPQAIELVDRYEVDGIWVDGEIWAVQLCYCDRCRKAFTEQYGITEPPTDPADENWLKWLEFTRLGFEDYVNRYVDAIHAHNPETRVCSNWLHSFNHPGPPRVRTDYLSGDNLGTFGTAPCNPLEARFMSTRRRPWEIVVWGFYYNKNAPWVMKPADMMQQQAASILALGGRCHIYNQPKSYRSGELLPWQMKRLGDVVAFAKARQADCLDTRTHPQAVVLHSEAHLYSQRIGNIWNHEADSVRGAVFAMMETSRGVDIMDEWALQPQLGQFPLVIVTAQDNMSEAMVDGLKKYVTGGGRLLIVGEGMFDRFGADFLGAESADVTGDKGYHIPTREGRFPITSASHQGGAWTDVHDMKMRLLRPTSAKPLGGNLSLSLLEKDMIEHPAAILNDQGKGRVAYVPFDLFEYYARCGYPMVRDFINELVEGLQPKFDIRVNGPSTLEVILRDKEDATLVHLINRSTGTAFSEAVATIHEIPPIGPVTIRARLDKRPESVSLLFEDSPVRWDYQPGRDGIGGELIAVVSRVAVHSALRIQ